MKLLFTLFTIAALPLMSNAQLPTKDGKVFYSEVIAMDSTSKDELYSRAKAWILHMYKSPKNVIQIDDKENGEIGGRAEFEFPLLSNEATVYYIINIAVKDNKYKYEIYSFDSYFIDRNFEPLDYPKLWGGKKKFYERLDENVTSTIESLKTAMSKKVDNNW